MQRATLLSERSPVVGQVPFDSVALVLRDLNKRLDDWHRRWTWSGARGALQMNRSSLRFAKLQGEHIRLSVNSIALKADARETAGSNESDWLQTCVVKAMDAAIALIDMHIEASETDLLFSYSFEVCLVLIKLTTVYLQCPRPGCTLPDPPVPRAANCTGRNDHPHPLHSVGYSSHRADGPVLYATLDHYCTNLSGYLSGRGGRSVVG